MQGMERTSLLRKLAISQNVSVIRYCSIHQPINQLIGKRKGFYQESNAMIFNPHKFGIHKLLKNIPLNGVFDAPYRAAVKKAVNIADLRSIAKARAHKVGF